MENSVLGEGADDSGEVSKCSGEGVDDSGEGRV